MDPANALWIGGPQGSGKSSIARALAERFRLQLYLVDHRVWVHERRMPATEFASLTMDERWVHATPERMLGWFVTHSRHRFRLVLEDLRELPDAPGVVVEGPQLFPTSVAAVLRQPDQALFLLPDGDELAARDRLIAAAYEREARDLRLATVQVDGRLDEVVERAAAHFAPVVRRLPPPSGATGTSR